MSLSVEEYQDGGSIQHLLIPLTKRPSYGFIKNTPISKGLSFRYK